MGWSGSICLFSHSVVHLCIHSSKKYLRPCASQLLPSVLYTAEKKTGVLSWWTYYPSRAEPGSKPNQIYNVLAGQWVPGRKWSRGGGTGSDGRLTEHSLCSLQLSGVSISQPCLPVTLTTALQGPSKTLIPIYRWGDQGTVFERRPRWHREWKSR